MAVPFNLPLCEFSRSSARLELTCFTVILSLPLSPSVSPLYTTADALDTIEGTVLPHAAIALHPSFQSSSAALPPSPAPHLAPFFTPSLPPASLPPPPPPPPPLERPLITHETTYTYTTTRTVDGTESTTTRKETITNYEVESITRPTVPAFVVTKFIRLPSSSGGRSDRASHARSFNGFSPFAVSPDQVHVNEKSHLLVESAPVEASVIAPTPVTYYTTFTYFTTELSEGHPVVHSREQIISTVIRGKVLPTRIASRNNVPRASVSRGDRSKRSPERGETGEVNNANDAKMNQVNNDNNKSEHLNGTSEGEFT